MGHAMSDCRRLGPARRALMSQSAWSMPPMICAKGPGSPHWIAMRRVRASSMARVASALSQGACASSGTKMLSSAGRLLMAPKALASGVRIGARSTQHSSLVMVGSIAVMLACHG